MACRATRCTFQPGLTTVECATMHCACPPEQPCPSGWGDGDT